MLLEETEWDILRRSCFAESSVENDEFLSRILHPGFRLRDSGETPWSRDSLFSASRCRELIERLTEGRSSTKTRLLKDSDITDNDSNTKPASTGSSGLSYAAYPAMLYYTIALHQFYMLRREWKKRKQKY